MDLYNFYVICPEALNQPPQVESYTIFLPSLGPDPSVLWLDRAAIILEKRMEMRSNEK